MFTLPFLGNQLIVRLTFLLLFLDIGMATIEDAVEMPLVSDPSSQIFAFFNSLQIVSSIIAYTGEKSATGPS